MRTAEREQTKLTPKSTGDWQDEIDEAMDDAGLDESVPLNDILFLCKINHRLQAVEKCRPGTCVDGGGGHDDWCNDNAFAQVPLLRGRDRARG